MADLLVATRPGYAMGWGFSASGAPDGTLFVGSDRGDNWCNVSKVTPAGTVAWGAYLDAYSTPQEIKVVWNPVHSALYCANVADPNFDGNPYVEVYKLDPETGYEVWSTRLWYGGAVMTVAAITVDNAGEIYIAGMHNDNNVHAARINPTTGAVVWANTYTVDGHTAGQLGVNGAVVVNLYGGLTIGGTRSTSEGFLLELAASTGVVSSRDTYTWAGLSTYKSSVTIGPDGRAVGVSSGTYTDPGNAYAYRFTAGATSAGVWDGTYVYMAEQVSPTVVRLHKVVATASPPVASISISALAIGADIRPVAVSCPDSDNILLALRSGNVNGDGYALRFNKDLTIAGTFPLFSITTEVAVAPTAVAATYGTFTSTVTPVTPTVSVAGGMSAESPALVALSYPLVETTNGTLSGTLPVLNTSFAGDSAVFATLPRVTCAAELFSPTIEAGMSVSLPRLTGSTALLAVQNGRIIATGPRLTASIIGDVARQGFVSAKLSRVKGTLGGLGAGGLARIEASLPTVRTEVSGGGQNTGGSLPAMQAAFQGTIASSGYVAGALARIGANVTGVVTTACSLDVSLRRTVAALAAIQGNASAISVPLPRITGSAAGFNGTTGQLNARMHPPVSGLQGSSALRAVLAVTLSRLTSTSGSYRFYQHLLTHVMNTLTTAVTTFDNYQFNSFAQFDGKYLAAGPDGLRIVDVGGNDAGAEINAVMRSGLIDFGSPQLKRMSDFYLAMRTEGDIALKVSTDELGDFEYALKPYDIETLKQRRDLIGKGMRGRYWQFELANTAGCDFDFDAYSMLVVDTSRRV